MDRAAALRALFDLLRRVAFRVLVVLAVAAVLSLLGVRKAHAWGSIGKELQVTVTCNGAGGKSSTGSTYAQACKATLELIRATYTDPYYGSDHSWTAGAPVCTDEAESTGGCSGSFKCGGAGFCFIAASGTKVTDRRCPENANGIDGAEICECSLGFKRDAGKCVPYTCGSKGSYSAVTQPDMQVESVGTQCLNGCGVDPSSVKSTVDGQLYATWPFVSTGDACGGKAGADKAATGESKIRDAPIPCGANQCPGTVNGASMCVPCKNTTIPGPSNSASSPGSAASGASSSIPNAPAGTVSSSQSTVCTQSVCTTTTIYKGADGTVTGTKTEDKGQDSFCKDNPDATICKKGAWGGTCGAYTCEGDAVQCALALRVHKTACQWEDVDPDLKNTGEAALSGGDRPEGHPFKNAAQTSMSFANAIDRSSLIGTGCPTDQVISYGGRSWVIPWGLHCDKLQLIGNLMVGVCMLAAAFIVFRS